MKKKLFFIRLYNAKEGIIFNTIARSRRQSVWYHLQCEVWKLTMYLWAEGSERKEQNLVSIVFRYCVHLLFFVLLITLIGV